MLEEEIAAGLHPSASGRLARAPLVQAVKDLESIYASRILFGENNVKGHLFLSAAVAQVESMEAGVNSERAITEAFQKSARYSLELLKKRTQIVDTPSDAASREQGGNADANSSKGGDSDFDFMNVEQDGGFDFVMQDGSPSFNFDAPDSWLFSGFETTDKFGEGVFF